MENQESPKEFIKIAIKNLIETSEYKNELAQKEEFLREIIYKFMSIKDIPSLEVDKYKIRLEDKEIKIIAKR